MNKDQVGEQHGLMNHGGTVMFDFFEREMTDPSILIEHWGWHGDPADANGYYLGFTAAEALQYEVLAAVESVCRDARQRILSEVERRRREGSDGWNNLLPYG